MSSFSAENYVLMILFVWYSSEHFSRKNLSGNHEEIFKFLKTFLGILWYLWTGERFILNLFAVLIQIMTTLITFKLANLKICKNKIEV